jgi:putative addiction module component (TIGR02574 family)
MPKIVDDIIRSALKLSEDERVRLIDVLIDSLATANALHLHESWYSEIERRSKEIDEGTATTYTWAEVSIARDAARRSGD